MKKTSVKGRANVEKQLINSAAELVGSIGPNQLSIRDIAEHANVNHAQIHHYFGGKAKLLEETYKQLAIEHVEQFKNKNISINNLGNQPLSSGLINNYYQAIIRAVLDGELDLAKLQVESNLSMSKELLSQLAASKNLDKPTPEMKSAIALGLVIEFGLAAMEDYIEDLLDMDEDDKKMFMKLFIEARQIGLNKI